MARVEQATAPGAAAPDETPDAATTPESRSVDGPSTTPEAEPTTRAGRRTAGRRSSQKSGRQSDPPQGRKPAQHAATEPTTNGDRVSLVKARPAHARDDDPAETGEPAAAEPTAAEPTAAEPTAAEPTAEPAPTEPAPTEPAPATSEATRAPRPGRPAHAGTPTYRPRHAKRNRRRWPVLLGAGLVLVALAGVGAAALVSRQDDRTDGATAPAATRVAPAPANLPTGPSGSASAPAPAAAAPAAPGTVECRFTPAPDKTPKILPPVLATRTGLVTATIGTNRGPISLELDATNAPCTVESFLTLAAGRYFNDTACHRLTTMLIFVLQCGDPTALGSGDPGYSFDDENLPAPGGTPYPRGTLAMANAGPDTNGSQFFIVYKDSPIDPNYPVFGRVTGGLEIIDRVAAGGAPGNDGQPNESLVIQTVQLA